MEGGDRCACLDHILAPELEVETSKPDGTFIAIVRVSDLGLEGRSAGLDHVRAVLKAWLECILMANAKLQEGLATLIDKGPHRSRSEQDRLSTRH